MKFFYPKDMNGNVIGFKTPESQVYDQNGKSLSDKLAEIYGGKVIGNAESTQGYIPSTNGKTGLAIISEDYGPTELGNVIEFHTKDEETYSARIRVDESGDLHTDNQYIKDASFIRYQNLTTQKTDINSLTTTGVYGCTDFINYPEEHGDGQGTLFVFNYSGNGSVNTKIMGTDNMWLTQIFLSAHSSLMWKRYVTGTTISSWVNALSEDLKSYENVDMIELIEDDKICPDNTVSRYRLFHPTNAPLENSDFNIEVYKLNSLTIRTIVYHVESTTIWTKVKVNDTWSDWEKLNKSENAKSVQGFEPNTDGKKGLATILTDYGITELGRTIDFHTTENQDFKARLTIGDDGLMHMENQFDLDFTYLRYKNFGDQEVNLDAITSTGVYRCTNFINKPSDTSDGQGTVIVLNYSAGNLQTSSIIGTDAVWLTQIYIGAHNHVMWKRYANFTNFSEWKNMGDANTLDGFYKNSFIFKDGTNSYMNPVTDLNNFYTGMGLFNESTLNLPSSDWFFVISGGISGTVTQVAFNLFNNTRPKTRNCASGTWSSWSNVNGEFLPITGGYFGAGRNGNLYADGNAVVIYAHNNTADISNSNGIIIRNNTYVSTAVEALALRITRSGSDLIEYTIHNDGNTSRVKITNDGTTPPSNLNTLWAY